MALVVSKLSFPFVWYFSFSPSFSSPRVAHGVSSSSSFPHAFPHSHSGSGGTGGTRASSTPPPGHHNLAYEEDDVEHGSPVPTGPTCADLRWIKRQRKELRARSCDSYLEGEDVLNEACVPNVRGQRDYYDVCYDAPLPMLRKMWKRKRKADEIRRTSTPPSTTDVFPIPERIKLFSLPRAADGSRVEKAVRFSGNEVRAIPGREEKKKLPRGRRGNEIALGGTGHGGDDPSIDPASVSSIDEAGPLQRSVSTGEEEHITPLAYPPGTMDNQGHEDQFFPRTPTTDKQPNAGQQTTTSTALPPDDDDPLPAIFSQNWCHGATSEAAEELSQLGPEQTNCPRSFRGECGQKSVPYYTMDLKAAVEEMMKHVAWRTYPHTTGNSSSTEERVSGYQLSMTH